MLYSDAPGQASASLAKSTNPLEYLEVSLREITQRVVSCRSSLSVAVDCLAGSQPETVGNAAANEPYCLTDWVDTLRREVNLLETQVARLSP